MGVPDIAKGACTDIQRTKEGEVGVYMSMALSEAFPYFFKPRALLNDEFCQQTSRWLCDPSCPCHPGSGPCSLLWNLNWRFGVVPVIVSEVVVSHRYMGMDQSACLVHMNRRFTNGMGIQVHAPSNNFFTSSYHSLKAVAPSGFSSPRQKRIAASLHPAVYPLDLSATCFVREASSMANSHRFHPFIPVRRVRIRDLSLL